MSKKTKKQKQLAFDLRNDAKFMNFETCRLLFQVCEIYESVGISQTDSGHWAFICDNDLNDVIEYLIKARKLLKKIKKVNAKDDK